MKLHLISTALLIVISVNLVFAQGDSTALWPVEERCVASPTALPDDWTYSGTLLMSGYAGVHAMQADWETPRVVASYYNEANGDKPIIGGQLSPDGKWFAAPLGETWSEPSFNTYHDVHGVRVYSTFENTVITSDFSNYSGDYVYYPVAWSYLPVEWVDNQSFIMGGMLFYPFEDRMEDAPFGSDGGLYERSLSPDHTRFYGGYTGGNSYRVGLYDPSQPASTFVVIENLSNIVWKRDSSSFIAQETTSGLITKETVENQEQQLLSLFDRDGNHIKSIMDLGDARLDLGGDYVGRDEFQWSPDNSQFAFSFYQYPEPSLLYLADFEKEMVIKTCLNPVSTPVWSPDGKQIQ